MKVRMAKEGQEFISIPIERPFMTDIETGIGPQFVLPSGAIGCLICLKLLVDSCTKLIKVLRE